MLDQIHDQVIHRQIASFSDSPYGGTIHVLVKVIMTFTYIKKTISS